MPIHYKNLNLSFDGEAISNPRRVSLTAGAVTTRMINRIAWEKGLVFAQCNGCKVWHNIKDAAGLVEEFRFKDGKEVDPADY